MARPRRPFSGCREPSRLGTGLVQRLREEQQKRQLLNDEMAHRLGNSFAGVQAIVNQSLAGEKELRETINARIAALAATNALLSESDWQVASLKEVLAGMFGS